MKGKETRQQLLTKSLFVVYLLLLTWIILFKMGISMEDLGCLRSVNLIPFQECLVINGKLNFFEIYANILIFLPFGVYLSMLKSDWSFFKKVAPIASVSLFYEVMQYILGIGASDITDFIGNTFGGIIGIAIYPFFLKLFKTDLRANKIINVLALMVTICIVAWLSLISTFTS